MRRAGFQLQPFVETLVLPARAELIAHARNRTLDLKPDALRFWRALRAQGEGREFSLPFAIAAGESTGFNASEAEQYLEAFVDVGALENTSAPSNTLTVREQAAGYIRTVPGPALHHYFVNTALWRRYGNRLFARMVVKDDLRAVIAAREIDITSTSASVAYHVSLPGLACEFAETSPTDQTGNREFVLPANRITERWQSSGPIVIDDLVRRSQDRFIAIQNERELKECLIAVQRLRPRTVVEIGTARGGTLFCLCQLADPEAMIISIDLPGAPNCGGQTEAERAVFASFPGARQQIEFIPLDSHSTEAKRRLRHHLGERKIDLLMIDGDHSYEGVKRDFESYRDLVSPNGVIAFHDTQLFPEEWGPETGVGLLWRELAAKYHTREIVDPDGTSKKDKPLEQASSWGIGLLQRNELIDWN